MARSLDDRRTITVIVNGAPVATETATLGALVAELGHAAGSVATAVNGAFVARVARERTELTAGDRIEIVAPRQGG